MILCIGWSMPCQAKTERPVFHETKLKEESGMSRLRHVHKMTTWSCVLEIAKSCPASRCRVEGAESAFSRAACLSPGPYFGSPLTPAPDKCLGAISTGGIRLSLFSCFQGEMLGAESGLSGQRATQIAVSILDSPGGLPASRNTMLRPIVLWCIILSSSTASSS